MHKNEIEAATACDGKVPGFRHWKPFMADILHWSKEVPFHKTQVLAGVLGMIGPVALGAFCDHLGLGMLASYGAMVVGGTDPGGSKTQQRNQRVRILLVGTIAIFIGSHTGGYGWLTGSLIVGISFVTALLGGMGRAAAQDSTRFLIVAIMGTGVGEGGQYSEPHILAAVFAAGSFWGIIAALVVSINGVPSVCHSNSGLPVIAFVDQLKRWWRSLGNFSGWQYTLRVTLSMMAAELTGILLQQQRPYWIFLTIALVLQRSFASAFARAVQRGIGTVVGVFLGGLLLLWTPPEWGMVLIIGVLAALRSFFKDRNYTLYAMIMTPLVVLIISHGQTVTGALLLERLLDTTIGCVIALTLGYFVWPNRNAIPRKVN